VRPPAILTTLICLWAAGAALGYDGVRREETDAGVHVPVLTRPPELLEFVQAPYPEQAQAEGRGASVRLLITIDETGAVSEAQVVEPVGHGFDEAAVDAVRQFRFRPAEVDHVPAPVQVEYVYHFVLAEPEPPPEPPVDADAGVDEAAAPRGRMVGEVVARGSRRRVPAASVRCGDEVQAPQALADEDGRFELQAPAGTCEVRVLGEGFELYRTTVEIPAEGTVDVVFHLMPTAIGYQTIVRGTRERKEVVRRTLERAELQRIPGTFGDPVRVIQNLPGVARAPFVSGALIVRGAAPDQTKTLFDGVEIPLLFHLGGGPSVVNAEFLDRVDFYPGGFGARYGRAVGGIVDVASRKGATDTWHGSLKVDLLDTGLFLEAPVAEGVSAAVAARRSYIDALLPLVLPDDPEGGALVVLPRYWDYQVRVDAGGKRGEQSPNRYYVMAFGSDDVLKVVASGGAINRPIELNVQTLFHRVKGDWTHRQGRVTSVLTPWAGFDLASFSFGVTSLSARVFTVGLREDFELEVDRWLTARAGLDLKFEHLRGEAELPYIRGTQFVPFPGADPVVETQILRRTINGFDGAAFAELDIKVADFTFTPGVRASRSRLNAQDRNQVEPRLWVRFAPDDDWAVKGSVGLYTQPPNLGDLERAPFGNPNLDHEKAFQSSLGVERRFTEALRADLTGYFNRRYDLVVSPGPTVRNEDGSFTNFRVANDGLGRAHGLELLVRHDVTRNFFGWVAYTLNRSEVRRTNPPAFAPAQGEYRLAFFDQTHILTTVGSYRLPSGFEVGARFRYVTGRPRTPLDHRFDIYGVDANSFRGTRGEFQSERFRAFHQLDLRLDKNFVFQSWTLNAYLDVQNVYNQRNIEATFTDFRQREEIEVPGVPFLPVVGVKGSF
jgi:TonB family protein